MKRNTIIVALITVLAISSLVSAAQWTTRSNFYGYANNVYQPHLDTWVYNCATYHVSAPSGTTTIIHDLAFSMKTIHGSGTTNICTIGGTMATIKFGSQSGQHTILRMCFPGETCSA